MNSVVDCEAVMESSNEDFLAKADEWRRMANEAPSPLLTTAFHSVVCAYELLAVEIQFKHFHLRARR